MHIQARARYTSKLARFYPSICNFTFKPMNKIIDKIETKALSNEKMATAVEVNPVIAHSLYFDLIRASIVLSTRLSCGNEAAESALIGTLVHNTQWLYQYGIHLDNGYRRRSYDILTGEIKNKYVTTLLCIAAQKGSLRMVRYLLDQGANPNVKNEKGWTALDYALRRLNARIAELLLQHGAVMSTIVTDSMLKLKRKREKEAQRIWQFLQHCDSV